MEQLPHFDDPPVVETVLSVQFRQLQGFCSVHAGWFWKSHLDDTWSTVREAVRLEDAFESFGEKRKWGQAGIAFRSGATPDRTQIIRADEERMIQLQDTRLVYNWRKRANEYPRYKGLLPEFMEMLEHLRRFANGAGMGELEYNQWEVTYVNHIHRGDMWDSVEDWSKILRNFYIPRDAQAGQILDGYTGNWSLGLKENLGRLHVQVEHVRIGSPEGPEALKLQLIARGPTASKSDADLERGLEFGHSSIVRGFTAMTSDAAHARWRRTI